MVIDKDFMIEIHPFEFEIRNESLGVLIPTKEYMKSLFERYKQKDSRC